MFLNNIRFKYFLIHFLVSIFIACTLAWVVFSYWYPLPFAKAVGVSNIFILMVIIDVILGPFLTLIVAKKGKASLKFDLMCILILQLVALAYGVYNIAITRPVWIAFDTMRFELIQANNIPTSELNINTYLYNQLSWTGAKLVAVKKPKDGAESTSRTFLELKTGISPSMRPSLYEPIKNQTVQIKEKALPFKKLYSYNDKNDVNYYLDKYPEANAYLPLKASVLDMAILVNKNTAEIIKVIDLRPWK